MRSCAKYLVKDSDSQESKNCGDARRQYKAFEKQVEAYESVKTGLNIKYVALWAMGGAMLLATILETKMWYFEEWKDNAIIKAGTADAAACITAQSLRPTECNVTVITACTGIKKYARAVQKLQGLRADMTTEAAESLRVDDFITNPVPIRDNY